MARLRVPRGYVPSARDLHGATASGGVRDREPLAPRSHRPLVDFDTVPGGGAGGGPQDVGGARSGRHGRRVRPRGWVRPPAALVEARWQPGRAAFLGVVVVALLAVAVFGIRVAWARSDAGGVVIAPGGGSRAGPTGVSAGVVPVGVPPGAASSGSARPSATPTGTRPVAGVVVVHVVGEVRRPGVLRLTVGARVIDALEAAGGATRKADLARVNLARVLVDGEQLRVPAPGDPDPVVGGGGGAGVPGPGGAAGGGGGLVPLNTADVAALDTLPGVGPVIAQRIVDWRTEHGRFTSVDELAEVSGIGEKLMAQVRPLVTL